MNYSVVRIEQSLHGYTQGHHLIESSVNLSKNSSRTMSILSDLSGPEIINGFEEYITGYPLVDDDYYVLAKTWYAPEMERPGCVWTHSLLIKFSDIEKIINYLELLQYFKRPNNFITDELYIESIEHISELNNFYTIDNINFNFYNSIINSLLSQNNPIIIPAYSNTEYENFILLIWQNFWSNLRFNFTFSTGSLANRQLNKRTFDLQIAPHSISKSMSRSDKNIILLNTENLESNSNSNWSQYFISNIISERNNEFTEFVKDAGAAFKERKYFKSLVQLYSDVYAISNSHTVENYLLAIYNSNNYDLNEKKLIIDSFVNGVANSIPNKWISSNDVLSFYKELSSITDITLDFNDYKRIYGRLKIEWNENRDKTKFLFKYLISNDINNFGEQLLLLYSELIIPDELSKLTDMDLGSCSILVKMKPELALCKEIWSESKNFQIEILDSIDLSKSKECSLETLFTLILNNSNQSFPEQIYKKFSDSSIIIFLNWSVNQIDYQENKIQSWLNICNMNSSITIEWLINRNNINPLLLSLILSNLDPYSDLINKYEIEQWYQIYQKIQNNIKAYSQDIKLILAEFFLPIILSNKKKTHDDFVIFSAYLVHEALANDKFDFHIWVKLEHLLPKLPWYQSWDKCKRLRLALENKGYTNLFINF